MSVPLALREEQRLKFLRNTFRPKREAVTGGLRKLCNKEFE
jgi:hypothetical protein